LVSVAVVMVPSLIFSEQQERYESDAHGLCNGSVCVGGNTHENKLNYSFFAINDYFVGGVGK
jgi:hypothetical protein